MMFRWPRWRSAVKNRMVPGCPASRVAHPSAAGQRCRARRRRGARPTRGDAISDNMASVAIHVSVDNFARAETDRMFSDLQRDAGGVNRFRHNRAPASIDEQTVIRMNRDTLYSFGVVNLQAGATLTLPDA